MKITLIRHPAPLIAPGICYGRLDVPTVPSAQDDIRRIAADPQLPGAARVWTSPALRCRGLADAISKTLAVPLIVDDRLRELDFGAWEGRPWTAVERRDLDLWAASPVTFAPPNGESGAALIARVRDVHTDLRHDGRDCIVVSHGGPLKLLEALLRARPVDLLATPPPIGSVSPVQCEP